MPFFQLVALLPVLVDGFAPKGCPGSVATSQHNVCVVMSDNKLYCSGASDACKRGRSTPSTSNGFHADFGTVVDGGTVRDRKVFAVASGYDKHKCAIVEGDDLNSREVTCFGTSGDKNALGRAAYGQCNNCYGQCLNVDSAYSCNSAGCQPDVSFLPEGISNLDVAIPNIAYVPVPLPDGFTPESVYATQARSCVIGPNSEGRNVGYCWGYYGQNPTIMPWGERSVVTLALSNSHYCVLFDDYTVSCSFNTPVTTVHFGGSDQKVVDVYAGRAHFCALLDSGDLYCWGNNNHLEAGGARNSNSNVPVKINLGQGEDAKVKMAALGYGHTCVLLNDDSVRCWGDNRHNILGYTYAPGSFVPVAADEDLEEVAFSGLGSAGAVPVHITAADQQTCAVFSDGSMQCWGFNNNNMMGANGGGSQSLPNVFKIPGMEATSLTIPCDYEATCEGITNGDCQSGEETFYTLTKGKEQVCGGSNACDTATCCKADFCELTAWGEDLPFVQDGDGNKIILEDKLDESSELHIKFTLATETCVDRTNWLGLTYHKLGTPVCTGGTDCSGKSEDECTDSCQFRIPCLGEELDASLSDAIFGEPHKTYEPERADVSSSDGSLKTKFVIKVKTDQLTTDGAGDIYTAPTDAENTGKLEFCMRPAVTADSSEILYREIVLRIHVGMGASFTVQVDSDSFQEGAVQNVDTDSVSITAEAFSCTASGDGYAKDVSTPTLKPNQLFTLCVIGSYTSIQCENIITLDFYQPRGESTPPNCDSESQTCNKDNRVAGGASSNPLLTSNPQNAVQVVKGTSTDAPVFKGCVVNARLDSNYFADVNPGSVTMTGTALLDFKSSTSNRRKLGESAHASQNLKMSERRALQGKQTAGFNLNFKLAEDEDPSKNRPQTEVDAASSSENYVAAALTAVAISAMM